MAEAPVLLVTSQSILDTLVNCHFQVEKLYSVALINNVAVILHSSNVKSTGPQEKAKTSTYSDSFHFHFISDWPVISKLVNQDH